MSTAQTTEEYGDNAPFSVTGKIPQAGDLSTHIQDDTVPGGRRVHLTIKNVFSYIHELDNGEVGFAKLTLSLQIGPDGLDGGGAYARRYIKIPINVYVNEEHYPTWKKWGVEFNGLLKSLGYDVKNPPEMTDEFITDLKGQEFIADVQRVQKTQKNKETGERVKLDEFENKLANFRAA